MTTSNNPLAAMLDQARELAEKLPQLSIIIDYDAIARAAIKVFREEQKKRQDDPRILMIQSDAHKRYGRSVITALMRRGYLQPYKFDLREAYDEEGNVITKAKGVVYYRVVEIEKAIEEGNVLKGTRRTRLVK